MTDDETHALVLDLADFLGNRNEDASVQVHALLAMAAFLATYADDPHTAADYMQKGLAIELEEALSVLQIN